MEYTITTLTNGMVRLIPKQSFKLIDNRTNKKYSEAVIEKREIKYFSTIPAELG